MAGVVLTARPEYHIEEGQRPLNEANFPLTEVKFWRYH